MGGCQVRLALLIHRVYYTVNRRNRFCHNRKPNRFPLKIVLPQFLHISPADDFRPLADHVGNATNKARNNPLAVVALGGSGKLSTAVCTIEHIILSQ